MTLSIHKKTRPERKTAKTHLCGPFYPCIKHFHAFILKDIMFLSLILSVSLTLFCFLSFFWDYCSGILVLLLLFSNYTLDLSQKAEKWFSNYNSLFSFKIFSDPHIDRWPCFHLLIATFMPCFRNSGTASLCFPSISVPFAFQQVSVVRLMWF